MRLNATEILQCTHGAFIIEPAGEQVPITSFTWDSRDVQPQGLFVALPGERVDGHDFVASAIACGARAILVMQEIPQEICAQALAADVAIIKVADTRQAITDLAREWRGRLTGRVIGLTGSVGKTTTKNLIRDVLSAAFTVTATKANQNNELGVPRTVLNAEADTQMIVVEMGMRGLGEIDALCSFVRPQWGVITTVGDSHIELLGSRDAIAQAKSELFEALPDHAGKAFFCAQDDYASYLAQKPRLAQRGIDVMAYAVEPALTEGLLVWASQVSIDAAGHPAFTLNVRRPDGSVDAAPCTMALRGFHNVQNACAAAAVGAAAGMDANAIAAALAASQPEQGRQAICAGANGCVIIDDSYNANPQSMMAALHTLAAMEAPAHRIAVLGDMGELGDYAPWGHAQVGALAATLALDVLVCVGPLSEGIAQAARQGGMADSRIICVADGLAAREALSGRIGSQDIVLVKASHYMELNKLVEGLEEQC